jgi:DNA-binding NarL/FixJ family response regulator
MATANLSRSDRLVVIRVAIVSTNALIRAGLTRLLERSGDIVVVGEAPDGGALDELRPDLVIVDLSTRQPETSGATRRIHEAHPDLRILVLSSHVVRDEVFAALAGGAVGYLLLDAPEHELLAGIRAAVSGGSPLAPLAAREVVSAWRDLHRPDELTARGSDVLAMLGEGLPNKVIAQRLGIAEKTVKAHVTQIFQTIGVTDRTQAALWVERHGRSPRQRERREQLRADARADAA